MSSLILLSNVRYFRRFLAVRHTVLALSLLAMIMVFTDLTAWRHKEVFQLIALAGLGVLGLFEWLRKPAFLEVQKSPSGLRGLSVYHPSNSFSRRFRAGGVRPLVVRPGDQLILHETDGMIPLFDQVHFILRRKGEPDISTRPLGIGWATPAERAKLRRVVDGRIHEQRTRGGSMRLPLGD